MFGKHKFRVGQRVQLSERGRGQFLLPRTRRNTAGTVTAVDKWNSPCVRWDHRKTATRYHADFIEPRRTDKPLTDRDMDTLGELEAATRNFEEQKYRDGWVAPMDCGGSNGSHHSYTLHKLAKRGLCDRKKYGGKREKGSCYYRINDAGRNLWRALARKINYR